MFDSSLVFLRADTKQSVILLARSFRELGWAAAGFRKAVAGGFLACCGFDGGLTDVNQPYRHQTVLPYHRVALP